MESTHLPDWTLDLSRALMSMVRAKDPATHSHCVRVSQGARLLAKAAGLNELDQKLVEFAGLFHDIGKVAIPDAVLNKPAKLTESEFAMMQDHPEQSAAYLAPLGTVDFFRRVIPAVRFHHERYDGAGYPVGVAGESIPLESRVILIADTFDAMTVSRVYRKGLPPEVAYKELLDFAGRQFDPRLVKIFLEAHPTWGPSEYGVFEEMNQTVLLTDVA